MDSVYLISCIVGLAIINVMLRGLPFMVPRKILTTRYFRYLGKFLPGSIMSLMVAYCLYEGFTPDANGILFIAGMLGVFFLHLLFNNFLVSVGVGSALYLGLLNFGGF